MVVMVMSILSILGIAMISLALSNYKMQAFKSDTKKNLYIAESGIDQAYGIIVKVIDEAVKNEKEEEEVKDYINDNLITNIIDISNYDDLYDGKLKVEVTNSETIPRLDDYNDTITLNLRASFKDKDIEKIVIAQYEIGYVDQSKISIKRQKWFIEK